VAFTSMCCPAAGSYPCAQPCSSGHGKPQGCCVLGAQRLHGVFVTFSGIERSAILEPPGSDGPVVEAQGISFPGVWGHQVRPGQHPVLCSPSWLFESHIMVWKHLATARQTCQCHLHLPRLLRIYSNTAEHLQYLIDDTYMGRVPADTSTTNNHSTCQWTPVETAGPDRHHAHHHQRRRRSACVPGCGGCPVHAAHRDWACVRRVRHRRRCTPPQSHRRLHDAPGAASAVQWQCLLSMLSSRHCTRYRKSPA
jgi:hypothetical protein